MDEDDRRLHDRAELEVAAVAVSKQAGQQLFPVVGGLRRER
jgi:hypothetical protein